MIYVIGETFLFFLLLPLPSSPFLEKKENEKKMIGYFTLLPYWLFGFFLKCIADILKFLLSSVPVDGKFSKRVALNTRFLVSQGLILVFHASCLFGPFIL